jgi:3-(3-hydroxy-phenyl)propionate hydroxylase
VFRDAVLDLAREHAFARTLVNSGRLSVPAILHDSPLNTPDSAPFEGRIVPGSAAVDAPVTLPDGSEGWLLRALGDGFTAIVFDDDTPLAAAAIDGVPLDVLSVRSCGQAQDGVHLIDREGVVAERYDLLPGSVVLLRPDQHVCARWRRPSVEAVRHALERALALH